MKRLMNSLIQRFRSSRGALVALIGLAFGTVTMQNCGQFVPGGLNSSSPTSSSDGSPASNDPRFASGVALYGQYCAACHGAVATSTKRGRNAGQIRAASESVVEMTSLLQIPMSDLELIALALSDSGGVPTIGIPRIEAAVLNANRMYPSMAAVAGIGEAAGDPAGIVEGLQSMHSVQGAPDSVTAPMMIAVINASWEVCNTMIEQEEKRAANARLFYGGIDLYGSVSAELSDAKIRAAVTRMTRNFWGRPINDEEWNALLTSLPEIRQAASEEYYSVKSGLNSICSTLMSSPAFLVQ